MTGASLSPFKQAHGILWESLELWPTLASCCALVAAELFSEHVCLAEKASLWVVLNQVVTQSNDSNPSFFSWLI